MNFLLVQAPSSGQIYIAAGLADFIYRHRTLLAGATCNLAWVNRFKTLKGYKMTDKYSFHYELNKTRYRFCDGNPTGNL